MTIEKKVIVLSNDKSIEFFSEMNYQNLINLLLLVFSSSSAQRDGPVATTRVYWRRNSQWVVVLGFLRVEGFIGAVGGGLRGELLWFHGAEGVGAQNKPAITPTPPAERAVGHDHRELKQTNAGDEVVQNDVEKYLGEMKKKMVGK